MNDEYKQWLESLKPGDKVFIDSYHGARIAVIDAITKTGRVKIGDSYYRNGSLMGISTWSWSNIYPVTQERIELLEKRKYTQFICNFNFSLLSHDDLKQIYDICKAQIKENENDGHIRIR